MPDNRSQLGADADLSESSSLATLDASLMKAYFELLYGGARLDWSRAYITRHIRKSLRRLRGAYLAHSQFDDPDKAAWCRSRAAELSEVSTTVVPAPLGIRGLSAAMHSGVGAAGSTLSVGAVLLGIPASASVGVVLVAWLGVGCYCHLLIAAWLASLIGIDAALMLSVRGRDKLAKSSASNLEAELFAKLSVRAPFEPSLSFLIAIGLATLGALTFVGRKVASLQWRHDESSPLAFHSSVTIYLGWSH